MLLTLSEFTRQAIRVSQKLTGFVGVDFETSGLNARRGDRAFIMGFADEEGKFCVRLDPPVTPGMELFFSNRNIYYVAHNEKFEKSFLKHQFGIELLRSWDSETMARLEYNNHKSYSLQNCALRIGQTKHVPMLDWLKQKGNKGQYHKAPADIIQPYVEQDAWLSFELACRQMNQFKHWDRSSPVPISEVVKLELRTAPHLFDMEEMGMLVDVNYCMRALEYEQRKIRDAKQAFERETGMGFVDSRKALSPIFDARGLRYGQTELGNASFKEEFIESQKSDPVVRAILAIRSGQKRASSYWENFLELEHNGVIHPSINAARAATGRMSISDPSCQNWPTDDDDPEFPIRRAFIARPDCFIVSIDYSQMELRLMVDEADDKGMIDAFKNGTDFHQVTADMAGVSRSLAKNGRFATLYGAGVARVAATLGITETLAATICESIDKSSPRVSAYVRELIGFAESSGYGYDFLGRRYFFDRGFSYKAPNYRIQGGSGEILRFAISDVGDYIRATRKRNQTGMLIAIHDELVFNIHRDDMDLIPEIKRLMIAAHRSKRTLDMDVAIAVGKNFFDLEEYAKRNDIQRTGS